MVGAELKDKKPITKWHLSTGDAMENCGFSKLKAVFGKTVHIFLSMYA